MKNGTIIGHYEILRQLGAGGMGAVYLAEDVKLDRRVALKILPPEFAEDADRMNRFVREAKSASALNHPNIITIHEIGAEGGTHFIATEFIDGKTLGDYAKSNSLDFKSALEIAIQVVSALDEAHAAGIIHRDIKPDNIMVRANGLAKILDFGIAKFSATPTATDGEAATAIQSNTQAGMIIGTPQFMSPEQARGRGVDSQTDIFSFGVVFYEMLAGASPFAGETVSDALAAVLTKEPPPLRDVPPELAEIINKSLQKEKRNRYQTAKDLLRDLKEVKQELEFQDKLERTLPPKRAEVKTQILQPATTDKTKPKSTIQNLKSIAVLPFTNMSADEENEYFSDGLTEELLNALAKIDDLKVAARTSAFSFKNKNVEAGEIGKTLNVSTVLEGSVRHSGNKLRITVQLINAANGYHLWSERYDREMQDIFDVQDEITLAVVDALKVKLFGDEKEAVMKRYTSNVEAYQLYLRGRFFFFKRTPEGFRKAIEYFERAIEIDDEYAVAYSGLADSYVFLGFYEAMSPAEAKKNLKPLTEKASELDDTLAETCASLALRKTLYDWDFKAGSAEFKKAIALNPKYTFAHHLDSATLVLLGLYDEAVAAEKRAIELEPFAAVFNACLGWWLHIARRADEAIFQSHKTIEIAPNHFLAYWVLGLAYGQTKKFPEAVASLAKALALTGGDQHIKGDLGRIYAASGRREEALKILSDFAEQAKGEYVSAVNAAKVYAGLGEREQMYRQLEKAVEERAVKLPYFILDPALDDFRAEARFQDIVRRVGLPTDETLEAQTVLLSPSESKTEQPADSEIRNANVEPDSKQTTNSKSEIQNPKSKWWLIGLLGLILIVSGFFAYRYFTPSSKQIESIAVMPFVNDSGSADVEYLSDGMTETLISSLSNLPNLSVKPRSSVFRYKGKETNPQTIAKELNVQAILNGRVVQRGNDLTLYIELIDAQKETVLWKGDYNRQMSNLVSLQSEIARDVSSKLKTKLSGAEQAKVAKIYTNDPEAYRLYLQALFYSNMRAGKLFERAEGYFKQAIERDPNFALAYAGLAASYGQFERPKAKEYIRRALALDDQLSEAHSAMGYQLMLDYDFAASERELKRAVELNPNNAVAYQVNGSRLMMLGRYDESLASFDRAIELEPTLPDIRNNRAASLVAAGKIDEGIEALKKSIELNPTFVWNHSHLSFIYRLKGDHAASVEARAHAADLLEQTENAKRLRTSFATGGWSAYLREIVGQNWGNLTASQTRKASFLAELGEKEEAVSWLQDGAARGDYWLFSIKYDPAFDSLRGDPRFQHLLKKFESPQ